MGDALSFTAKGTFILGKVHAHGVGKLKDVLADVYRDAVPDPMDISRFEWEVIQPETYRARYSHFRQERAIDATPRMLAARPAESPQPTPRRIPASRRNA